MDCGRERSTRERAEAALDGVDLLLTPTLGFVAPPLPVDDLAIRERTIRLTIPFNALGWPTLALPCGPAEDGLPASLQIVGPPGSDALVLAAGNCWSVSSCPRFPDASLRPRMRVEQCWAARAARRRGLSGARRAAEPGSARREHYAGSGKRGKRLSLDRGTPE